MNINLGGYRVYCFVIGLCITLAVSAGIFVIYQNKKVDYRNLSVQDLEKGGYYAYVLPSPMSRDWNRRISMISFDWHCSGSENRWNPVTIRYIQKADPNLRLTIRISPSDALFDDLAPNNPIEINTDWIPDRSGVYYINPQRWTYIKVIDNYHLEIVFSSSVLKAEELANIISQLVFAGSENNTNPWIAACN